MTVLKNEAIFKDFFFVDTTYNVINLFGVY